MRHYFCQECSKLFWNLKAVELIANLKKGTVTSYQVNSTSENINNYHEDMFN